MKRLQLLLITLINLCVSGAFAQTINGSNYGGADFFVPNGAVLNGAFTNIGTFRISAGSTVFVTAGSPLSIQANTIIIDGSLNGTGRGYAGGSTNNVGNANGLPGSGPGGGQGGLFGGCVHSDGGAGGGYGGNGGNSGSAFGSGPAPVIGGSTYGTINTFNSLMGSGGGAGGNYCTGNGFGGQGGAGGAAIYLQSNTITVSSTGAIIGDGQNGLPGTSSFGLYASGGGGSGGTIEINCVTGVIGGMLSANGGNGYGVSTVAFAGGGGGGGGGRIKISNGVFSLPASTITVNGGIAGLSYGTFLPQNGQPGTTFGVVICSLAGALNFDGVNDYVSIPALNLNSNHVTIEAWIKPNGNQGDFDGIVFSRAGNSVAGIGIKSNNELEYHWNDDGLTYAWPSGAIVTPNQWSHIALVIEPTKATIYLNGIAYANNVNHSIEEFNGITRIGKDDPYSTQDRHFNGNIEEVRIWNRSLSQAEIQHNANCELTLPQTSLIAYYKFNQGFSTCGNTGITSLTDASGNNNTGTLFNFALVGSQSNWVLGNITGNCSPFDQTPPNLTCPENIIASTATGQCSAIVNFEATASDPSGVASITYSKDPGTVFQKGLTTVTVAATDGLGNIATCSFTVTVYDNEKPTFICTTNQNVDLNTSCQLIVPDLIAELTGSDNCGTVTLIQSPVAGASVASSHNQTHDVVITANDGNGNTQTCTVVLTGKDVIKPSFACPSNQNINLNSSCQLVVPNLISELSGNDNCGTVTFTQSPLAGASLASSHNQPHNVLITASDGNGNTQTCTVVLTGKDVIAPVINCLAPIVVNTDNNTCGAIVNYGNNNTIQFSQQFIQGQASPHCNSWKNFRSQLLSSYNYTKLTIKGSLDPVGVSVTNPALVLQLANALRTGTSTTIVDNGRTWMIGSCGFDNIGQAAIEISAAGSICQCPSSQYIVRPCIDVNSGNPNWGGAGTNTCSGPSQTLTVVFEIAGSSGGVTATDNCGIPLVTQLSGLSSGALFPVGTTTNTFIATDAAGNTSTCNFTVTVNDNQKPTFNCSSPQNVNLNATCQLVVPDLVTGLTGSDNCGTVTFTQSPLAGASFASSHNQMHNVVITASDGNGNTQTCTVVLTGKDVTKPTFTCPDNQNVNLNTTCQLVVPNLIADLTGVDNCGTVTFTQSPIAGASLGSSHNQTHNVLITASDGNGNTQTCTVVLTSKDVTKPTFICPDNQNINLNATCQLVVPNLIAGLTGSDNCGTVTFTQSPTGGASLPLSHNQTHNILITASDGNGNTQTCTVVLTGKDVTKPSFSCPYNQNVNLNGTCQLIVPNLISGLAGNDNCGTVTFTQSPIAGASVGSSHNQTHNILITANDGNGNTETCTVVLTGKDVTKPTFSCPINRNVNLNGTCQLIVPNLIAGLTGYDNCGTVTFTQNPVAGASFASSHNQTQNVLITANDGNGNTETCAVVLTAKDITLPVITCPSPKTISCDASILPANTGSATATDNCSGVPVITYSDVSGQDPNASHAGYYNYTITRTWKAMDVATNTSTCNQTITVQDITKPMITCPSNKLNVPFDFGQLYATIAIGTATATDNCAANANIAIAGTRGDNVVITNQQYPLGQTTVAWSATDPSDNSEGCTQTITVRKRNTAVTYTGDMIDGKIWVQYSDIINLQAKLTDNEGLVIPNNISNRTITFQLLSGTTVLRSKSATTKATGVAVDTFKIEQAPGLYSVKTIFAGDNYFNGSNGQDNCEVKQEDAILEYNGSQYFTTASSTTLVGSITLAAAVNDIDDGSDKRGDIRKAKSTFRDGGPGGTVLGSANLPVGLVNPGILTNGLSATTQNNISLNSNEAGSGGKIFQVWVGASDHYKGADVGPTPVTLALPGLDFVTGGGHLVVTSSAGTYAGTANSKMNFGFTMKWNKSGKSLQGNINIVFRKWQLYNGVLQWRVYQMKSNAINSMAVVEVGSNGQPATATNPAVFRKAIINTKGNLKDVTDPLNNIDLGGNHNLTLDAWDHITANGGISDKISVTLMGATTNELLFSSSWVSNATAAQTITGGNINVRNGTSSSSTSINSITKSGQMEAAVKEGLFVVKAYPNPTEHQFTLVVNSSLNEKIEIQLYDVVGRKIQTLSANANETIRFGEKLKTGVYIAKVIQRNRKESIKLIKQ